MLLREKVDEEGATFSDQGDGADIYLCAKPTEEEGKYVLFEQIGDVNKEGVHDVNRKVVVTREFIEDLHQKVIGGE
jgi:hypothetical protein